MISGLCFGKGVVGERGMVPLDARLSLLSGCLGAPRAQQGLGTLAALTPSLSLVLAKVLGTLGFCQGSVASAHFYKPPIIYVIEMSSTQPSQEITRYLR